VTTPYLTWGIVLWLAFLASIRLTPDTQEDRRDGSVSFALTAACLFTLLVATWPVTLTIALVHEMRRKP